MPGILPMKVIRVGTSTQNRIAQACDRCRSKKIRCDGIRPTCTQCQNVGFECKTSDKLSRRAFPRGYTESLEDRVRGLEAEVRELKQLLDEKDEKIDVLSRIHNFSPSSRDGSTSLSPAAAAQIKAGLASVKEDVLEIEVASPTDPATLAPGPPSTAAFIDSFDRKLNDCGRSIANIRSSNFNAQSRPTPFPASSRSLSKIPPRLLSDQYINLFFQEWQPLLPLFHRPSFLRVYEQFIIDPEASHWHSNKTAVAQLYLIFDIAAISSISRIKQSTTSYEQQWKKALHSTSSSPSVSSIQCHILAQLYYLLKADYAHLGRHRALTVSMCHQLGLHQNQKYLSVPCLEVEMRKRMFWCQYVLDKFASAATGTPYLLRDDDIAVPYPADVDDENVSSEGFSPVLPGELTKISSALALIKVSRILAKVLDQLYPPKSTYEISLSKLYGLADELDEWSSSLPTHLRLHFSKDKPATNLTSCRSPLLSLAYFYIRALIHRPAVCYGSGNAASAAIIVIGAAAKHTLQILELLDERRMNYTFPVNKTELLLFAGFSLLWQCLELEDSSKIMKDNQKLLTSLTQMLIKDNETPGNEFLRIASKIVILGVRRQSAPQPSKDCSMSRSPTTSLTFMPAPSNSKQKSTRKVLQGIVASIPTFSNNRAKAEESGPRRATVPRERAIASVSPHQRSYSAFNLSSARSTPALPTFNCSTERLYQAQQAIANRQNVNLDYYPIGEEDGSQHSASTATLQPGMLPNSQLQSPSWEELVSNIDSSAANIFSGVYSDDTIPSNRTAHKLTTVAPKSLSSGNSTFFSANTRGSQDWMPPPPQLLDESWDSLSAVELESFHEATKPTVPQSVVSFGEESLTSGGSCEDLIFSAAGSNNGSSATNESDVDELCRVTSGGSGFKGIAMPNAVHGVEVEEDDGFGFADR